MSVEGRTCPVCEREIKRVDIAVQRPLDGELVWMHQVHRPGAIRRFLEEREDHVDPVEWDREERPCWWWDSSLGTWWHHRSQAYRVGHDRSRYPSR
jgi:hypothetical protein